MVSSLYKTFICRENRLQYNYSCWGSQVGYCNLNILVEHHYNISTCQRQVFKRLGIKIKWDGQWAVIERLYEILQEKELEMHLRSVERILFLVSEDEMPYFYMLSLATKIRQHKLYIIKITHDSRLGFLLFPMYFFSSISQSTPLIPHCIIQSGLSPNSSLFWGPKMLPYIRYIAVRHVHWNRNATVSHAFRLSLMKVKIRKFAETKWT